MEKIQYLDGIRGLAALNVLLTHFIVAFYPALYTGKAEQVHAASLIEAETAKSLWTIFYAGNIAVPVLFVLSAYVLSFRFFMLRDTAVATAGAYRRYMRLEMPVLAAILLSWAFLHFGLYYNGAAAAFTHSQWWLGSFYQFEPSFFGAVKQALWECFAVGGNVNYDPVLWTMNFEMLGSFSVFGFLALFGKSPRRYVVYLVMLVVFSKSYYLAFVMGMMLSDLQYSDWGRSARAYLQQRSWLTGGFILAGLLLGSYFNDGRNAWCRAMDIRFLLDWGIDLYAFYHVIGAALVLLGCLYNGKVQALLSGKILGFFGRIAFSLYLVHFIVLLSFGSFLFVQLYQGGMSYGGSVAITIALTAMVVFLAAYGLTKYVDEPAMRLAKRIQQKYFY